MTPQSRTAVIVTVATASSAVLVAAGLAAFTDFSPSRIAALTAGWIIGCVLALFAGIPALAEAGRTVERIASQSQNAELPAFAEDGAR